MELKYQPLFYYSFFLCDGASCQVIPGNEKWHSTHFFPARMEVK